MITCNACHNAKTLGLTSVTFPSGFKAENQGSAARCMTCHQGVEFGNSVNAKLAGIADDKVLKPKLEFINVHYAAAGAMLFGTMAHAGYEYAGKTYAGRFAHKAPYVTCTNCHELHTVAVKVNDCAACHKEVTDKASLHKIRTGKADRDGNGDVNDGVAQEVENLRGKLIAAIMDYAKTVNGKAVAYDLEAYPYFFNDSNGSGKIEKAEAIFPNRYKSWTLRLLEAAYNYQFITKDPGAFAHNGSYAIELLQDLLADLRQGEGRPGQGGAAVVSLSPQAGRGTKAKTPGARPGVRFQFSQSGPAYSAGRAIAWRRWCRAPCSSSTQSGCDAPWPN